VKEGVQAQVALVLHAHLPYVRHPEHPRFYEESWLFEAITECYLPLAWKMEAWSADRLPWRLSLTITPTLAEMLGDAMLADRYREHLESMLDLGRRELDRTALDPVLRPLAEDAMARLRCCQSIPEPGRWLLGEFRRHQEAGNLKILGCAATHALLPLLVSEPASIRAQLAAGVAVYRRWFGRAPRGFWLPECGWVPELETPLLEAGIEWVVLEGHGVTQGTPPPHSSLFRPVRTPGGLMAVGRDPASARQVWSRSAGYPGDPAYREFHRDLGHDAEWEYVGPHLPTGRRTFTGFKYHRITGADVPADAKQLYDRPAALEVVERHAAHFVLERLRIGREVSAILGRAPLLVAPYDAELFGHWWHEGPEFLDQILRRMVAPASGIDVVTPQDQVETDLAMSMPATSSWGDGGHFGVWLDASNADMQTPLRRAGAQMGRLADQHMHRAVSPLEERTLRQAGRELLLAQASDWPFLVKMNTAGEYPKRRFHMHLERFHQLAAWLDSDSADESVLTSLLNDLEWRSPLFPDLDWREWRSQSRS
jgi:1,4-alpha-glucan branching enzyme